MNRNNIEKNPFKTFRDFVVSLKQSVTLFEQKYRYTFLPDDYLAETFIVKGKKKKKEFAINVSRIVITILAIYKFPSECSENLCLNMLNKTNTEPSSSFTTCTYYILFTNFIIVIKLYQNFCLINEEIAISTSLTFLSLYITDNGQIVNF